MSSLGLFSKKHFNKFKTHKSVLCDTTCINNFSVNVTEILKVFHRFSKRNVWNNFKEYYKNYIEYIESDVVYCVVVYSHLLLTKRKL